ncbi:MAG: formate dehydrogenase [Burkholderiales bacterium]|nr:formate dehydrogenase [Burkholderiales bacterium]
MKFVAFGSRPSMTPVVSSDKPAESSITTRRDLLLGAGAVGAAVIAAKTLPSAPAQVADATKVKSAAGESDGYQETQHVLRYYETTRV